MVIITINTSQILIINKWDTYIYNQNKGGKYTDSTTSAKGLLIQGFPDSLTQKPGLKNPQIMQ